MSKLTNFGVALLVSIILVVFFSFFGDGNPSEAASIIIQAFWLIATLIKVIFSIIVVFAVAIIFVILSFMLGALNFFLETFNQTKLSTTFLLNMQEDALNAVEVLYQGIILFLENFKVQVEKGLDVTILWNPDQTFGSSVEVIGASGIGILGGIGDAVGDLFDAFGGIGDAIIGLGHDAIDWGVSVIQDGFDWGVSVIQDGFDWGVSVIQDTVDWGASVAVDTITWGLDVVDDTIKHGHNLIDDGIVVIQDTAEWGASVIVDTGTHAVNVAQDTTEWGISVTHDAIDHTADVIQDIGCFIFGC